MTDPTLFDIPDPAYPVDSQVPDVRDLGPWFWERPMAVVWVTEGRL